MFNYAGLHVGKTIIYQDKSSFVLLKNYGKTSRFKITKHIKTNYFFVIEK